MKLWFYGYLMEASGVLLNIIDNIRSSLLYKDSLHKIFLLRFNVVWSLVNVCTLFILCRAGATIAFMVGQSLENLEKSGNKICVGESESFTEKAQGHLYGNFCADHDDRALNFCSIKCQFVRSTILSKKV